MVSVCLPSDALSRHLLSYLGFSYLRRGVSLHGCSSKVQPLLLTLDMGYLLTATTPDLGRGVSPLRKAMPKNDQTTTQLHSSHMIAKEYSKFSRPGFSNTWSMNFQMFKLILEKAEEPEIKLPTSAGSSKKQENSRKPSAFASVMPKPLTVWITNWKILWEMGIPEHLSCLHKNLYAGQEATVRTGHGTTD